MISKNHQYSIPRLNSSNRIFREDHENSQRRKLIRNSTNFYMKISRESRENSQKRTQCSLKYLYSKRDKPPEGVKTFRLSWYRRQKITKNAAKRYFLNTPFGYKEENVKESFYNKINKKVNASENSQFILPLK